jgi:flagellar protein FliS
MLNNEAYSSYHAVNLDAQTSRASPVELVLVLTDGLLEELARARGHIVGKRYEQRPSAWTNARRSSTACRARSISTTAARWWKPGRLYDYCAGRLYTAGVKLDPTIIDEVTTLMTTIKRGWLGVQANNG